MHRVGKLVNRVEVLRKTQVALIKSDEYSHLYY